MLINMVGIFNENPNLNLEGNLADADMRVGTAELNGRQLNHSLTQLAEPAIHILLINTSSSYVLPSCPEHFISYLECIDKDNDDGQKK